ncbi:MAG TPA: protein-glutamate O-methyltransferase CheR [Acidimicrobiales bacterium]|jgi:chemotaxis protein methyltransferase CheR|nr:protein-glutamate O-methyltransferase CheR [Acidimicrobiales bacterium]
MSAVATDFSYLQQLVLNRSAIVLSDDKEYLVESRLSPIARELGLEGVDAVLERLRLTRERALEDRVVEAMTTNETLWFRDVHPFNALRRTVFPEIIARRAPYRQLAVWSAASSSGQELYSITMLLAESFPQVMDWHLSLHGTDLSSEMVNKARAGKYTTLEINRGLPATMMVRNFDRDGSNYVLKDEVRRMTTFRQMNLAEPWPTLPKYDLILIRNVLIYFDLPTRKKILESAARCLDPNGYLFIGSSETMMGVTDVFEAATADGATFYRLKGKQ